MEWVDGFFLRKPNGLRDFLAAEAWVSLEPLRVLVEVAAEGGVCGRNEYWEREVERCDWSMLPKLESLIECWVVPVPRRGRVRMAEGGSAGLALLLEAVVLADGLAPERDDDEEAAAGALFSDWKSQGLMSWWLAELTPLATSPSRGVKSVPGLRDMI